MSSSHLPSVAQRLIGKVALITGGASGIGHCTAKLFRRHGAKVVILDIQDELGKSVADEISGDDDGGATYIHCDVTREDDLHSAVDTAFAKYGKIDVMFSNAGVAGTSKFGLLQFPQSAFDRAMSVNVTGMFLAAKHAARVMIPERKGSIILTASIAGVVGGATNHAYTASKHATVGLTRNLAAELGQFGIRVNCISPSWLETPMATREIGLRGRHFDEFAQRYFKLRGVKFTVEDVAEAALYLAGDESKFTTGHNLVVDGGHSVIDTASNLYDHA
ncbi:Tropinone reductase-like 1 [Nymphaea thermarum]|nr:Tropinone reductase-like 1 [Nymphaea thermarum]